MVPLKCPALQVMNINLLFKTKKKAKLGKKCCRMEVTQFSLKKKKNKQKLKLSERAAVSILVSFISVYSLVITGD